MFVPLRRPKLLQLWPPGASGNTEKITNGASNLATFRARILGNLGAVDRRFVKLALSG